MCEARGGRLMKSGGQGGDISMPPFQIFDLSGGIPEPSEFSDSLTNAGEGKSVWI